VTCCKGTRGAGKVDRDLERRRERLYVSFSCQDGDDVDRFQLEIVDADHADLRFLLSDHERAELAANGIPVSKPIRLTRMP